MAADRQNVEDDGWHHCGQKMRRKHLIILIVVLLTTLVAGAILVVRMIDHRIYEAYALMRTNLLLINYICQHEAWPSDWDSLVPVAESSYPGSGESEVAELRDVVGINWNVDIAALLKTEPHDDRSGFQTTYLLSGSTAKWWDSNEEIYSGVVNCP